MLKGFVSYAHENTSFLEELKPILRAFELEKRAKFWTDHAIKAGDQWRPEIMAQLDAVDIAVILASQPLYDSDFVRNVELPRLKERRDANEITVVTIRISAAYVPGIEIYRWLRDEQQIPRDGRFIETAPNRNVAWAEVATELSHTLNDMIESREAGISNSAELDNRRDNARSVLRHAQTTVLQVPENIGEVARADIERGLHLVETSLMADPLNQQDSIASAYGRLLRTCATITESLFCLRAASA